MTVYVFGNPDTSLDNRAIQAANKIKGVDFVFVSPNQDLPFAGQKNVVIMDTVQGIDEVTLYTEKDLDKIVTSPSTTAHDYDLGFQLKYLTKLGQLGQFSLIALPQSGNIDYDRIHSIFRKLVEQDMQGS